MRKICLVITLLLLVALPACAASFRSEYGYTLTLPDGWSILSREYVDGKLAAIPDALGMDMFLDKGKNGYLSTLIYPAQNVSTGDLDAILSGDAIQNAEGTQILGLKTLAGRDWFCLTCRAGGKQVLQASCAENGRLYTFTFVDIGDTNVIRSILSTFATR